MEDYLSITHLLEFGAKLKTFPEHLRDQVILEQGEDSDRWAAYLFLRAFIHDSVGHAGLEVKMRINGGPAIASYARYTIATEAASINEFGRTLVAWTHSDENTFEHQFHTGLH